MSRSGVVDIHAHYYPESYIRIIVEDGARCGARCADGAAGPLIHVDSDVPAGPITPAFIDLTLRIAAMDRQGVQWQALSLSQPMVYSTWHEILKTIALEGRHNSGHAQNLQNYDETSMSERSRL